MWSKMEGHEMERVKPLVERCSCGKKVTDHHFKCNECWGKTAKFKHRKEQRKLMEPVRRRLRDG